MASLTVTLTEAVTINGTDQGATYTKSISGINDVLKRVVTVPTTEVILYATADAAVAGSTFDDDLVKYVRVRNLDSSKTVDLIIQNADDDEIGLALGPGESYVFWDHSASMNVAHATGATVTPAVAAAGAITVADGDADHTPSENDYLELINASGLTKRYVFIDGNATSITTGAVLFLGNDSGASTITSANDGGIAVAVNITGTQDNEVEVLSEIKDAIEHINGHNGSITVGAVPTGGGVEALTVTQATQGTAGNTTITESVTHAHYTVTSFTGGVDGIVTGKNDIRGINAISNIDSCRVEVLICSE